MFIYSGVWNDEKVHLDTRRHRDVEKAVARQKVCHKAWWKSKSAEDKHALNVAKRKVYTAVMTAQEFKLQEFTADLQN